MLQRYPYRFTDADDTPGLRILFPLNEIEWDTDQDFHTAYANIAGADYGYDLLRSAVAPVSLAKETIRFVALPRCGESVDTYIDRLKSRAMRIGRGKLWTIGADNSRRWAWCRLDSVPKTAFGRINTRPLPVVLEFTRQSPWFARDATVHTEAGVVADGYEFTVTNPGDLPAKLVVVQLKANGAAGMTNPVLTNLTNDYVFGTARDSASADDEIKLDTEAPSVEYSTDNGASYVDDIAQYTIPTDQPALSYQFEPAANTLRFNGGGSPDLDIVITFYPVFAA